MIILAIITLYIASIVGIYIFQDIIIFQPSRLKSDHNFEFENKFTEHFITTFDGHKLNALHFRTDGKSKGLVLYFHGNADNLKRWGKYAIDFTRKEFDVLMIDYRGFGKSTGHPSEEGLYADALCTLKWAQKNLNHEYDKLIIYGRSLGSAIATELATKHTPDLLILETPFDSIRGALTTALKPLVLPFPLRFNLENTALIPKVKCRIFIITGTRDHITPLASALRLKPHLKEKDQFIIIPKGRHKNLRKFGLFHLKLGEALNG
jgi:alpha-beta hydrolase superfamily lysophospholipase